jgi:hypothetical protein
LNDFLSKQKFMARIDLLLERLAETRPQTLACMHGSAWRGDGAALLRSLAVELDA